MIRVGWVSNSSSSSFAIIGKRLNGLHEVDLSTGDTYLAFSWEGGYEGIDCITLTPGLLNAMKNIDAAFDVWLAKEMVYEEKKNVHISAGEYDIMTVEVDQNSTTTIEELYERYE